MQEATQKSKCIYLFFTLPVDANKGVSISACCVLEFNDTVFSAPLHSPASERRRIHHMGIGWYNDNQYTWQPHNSHFNGRLSWKRLVNRSISTRTCVLKKKNNNPKKYIWLLIPSILFDFGQMKRQMMMNPRHVVCVCLSCAVLVHLCLMSGLVRELVSTGECLCGIERADLRYGGQRPAQLRPWRGRLLALWFCTSKGAREGQGSVAAALWGC